MGDKGGKKDKDKVDKQKANKQAKELKEKKEKEPKSVPKQRAELKRGNDEIICVEFVLTLISFMKLADVLLHNIGLK